MAKKKKQAKHSSVFSVEPSAASSRWLADGHMTKAEHHPQMPAPRFRFRRSNQAVNEDQLTSVLCDPKFSDLQDLSETRIDTSAMKNGIARRKADYSNFLRKELRSLLLGIGLGSGSRRMSSKHLQQVERWYKHFDR